MREVEWEEMCGREWAATIRVAQDGSAITATLVKY
jgi:hypothetical protein